MSTETAEQKVKTVFDHLDADVVEPEEQGELSPIEDVPEEEGLHIEEVEAEGMNDPSDFDHLDDEYDDEEEEDGDGFGEDDLADDDDDSVDGGGDADEDAGNAEVKNEEQKGDGPIPTELLMQAGRIGMTAEQVAAFPNADSLQAAISILESKSADARADGEGSSGQEQESDELPEYEEIVLDIPEDFDDDTRDLLQGIGSQFNAKLKDMHEQMKSRLSNANKGESKEIQALKEQLESTQRREFFDWYDNKLNGLGEEWQQVFGKGNMETLDETSKEAQNRIQLTVEMDRLYRAHPEWGKEKLLDAAMKLAFSEQYEKVTADKARKKSSDYKQQRVTQRPTAKNTQIAKPKSKKAVEGTVSKMLKKLGL